MTVKEAVQTAAETSRRSVIKGAAWSLPVIAAAVAAPMAAASDGDGQPEPQTSRNKVKWNNHSIYNSKPAVQGGIQGNVNIENPWVADGETITAIIMVTLNGQILLNETRVIALAQSTGTIPFENTMPLEVGKSYLVVFTVTAKDASGRTITSIGNTSTGVWVEESPAVETVTVTF